MRMTWKALIASTFDRAAVVIGQTNARGGGVFTKDGDLVLPAGFRVPGPEGESCECSRQI